MILLTDLFLSIDDSLIYSRSQCEHQIHVHQAFQHLEKKLYVKTEKCDFYVESVLFLGFIVEKELILLRSRPRSTDRTKGFWVLQTSTAASSVITGRLLCHLPL